MFIFSRGLNQMEGYHVAIKAPSHVITAGVLGQLVVTTVIVACTIMSATFQEPSNIPRTPYERNLCSKGILHVSWKLLSYLERSLPYPPLSDFKHHFDELPFDLTTLLQMNMQPEKGVANTDFPTHENLLRVNLQGSELLKRLSPPTGKTRHSCSSLPFSVHFFFWGARGGGEGGAKANR